MDATCILRSKRRQAEWRRTVSPHSSCILEQAELPSRENGHRVDRSGSGRGKRPKTLRDTFSGGLQHESGFQRTHRSFQAFVFHGKELAEHTVRGGSRGHLRQQRLSQERRGLESKGKGITQKNWATLKQLHSIHSHSSSEQARFDLCGPGGKGFPVLPCTLASFICNFPWSLCPVTRRKFSHQNKPRYIATLCQNSLNMIFFRRLILFHIN